MSTYFQSGEQDNTIPSVSPMRYDETAQQRIIALAAQLQHQHQGTATAAELEAIAAEIGLEPVFVRQAIALIDGHPSAAEPARRSRFRSGRACDFWNRSVSPWTTNDAKVVGGSMALAALSCGTHLDGAGFALALALGLSLGPKRRIAWVGAATLASEMAVGSAFYWHQPFFDWHIVVISAFGAGLAGLGAATRGLFNALRRASAARLSSVRHERP